MTGGGIDRRGPKDSENAHNSFLTKSTEKGFWRFAVDMDYTGMLMLLLLLLLNICQILFLSFQNTGHLIEVLISQVEGASFNHFRSNIKKSIFNANTGLLYLDWRIL